MAVGPGTASTSMPSAAASRTSTLPGSLMQGVPASVTTATVRSSSSIRWGSEDARCSSLCWWLEMQGVSMPKWLSSARVTRVSSAAIKSALLSVSIARGVMSLRLPIGVATT